MITEKDGGASASFEDDDVAFDHYADPAAEGAPVAEAPAEKPIAEAPTPKEPEPQPEAIEAPVAAAPEPVKEQPTETHRVPLSEHLAEREKRQEWERKARELEQRLQQAQPKEPAKAPEFWEQPENSIDYRVQQAVAPLQQALQQQAEMFSRTRAEDKYGADAVQAAFEDLAGRMQQGDQFARFDYQRIMSSPHPYGMMVEMHRERATLREIGNDPAAYKERLAGDLLKDPTFLAKALEAARAQAQPGTVVNLAPARPKPATLPSVSNMGSAGTIAAGTEDESDDDKFDRLATGRR